MISSPVGDIVILEGVGLDVERLDVVLDVVLIGLGIVVVLHVS